jgi:hypothetical protein
MKCETCGKTYPSEYYFFLEGRTAKLICTSCSNALSEEERKAMQDADSALRPAKGEGIGGWLALWMVNLLLIVPVATGAVFRIAIPALKAQPSGWTVGALLYGILFCAFSVFAVVEFARRRRKVRRLMIAFLGANLLFWAVNGTLIDSVDVPLEDWENEFAIQNFAGALAGCLIWIPYFLVSTRVKRTFVV